MPFGIDVEDEQVAVVSGADLDLGAVPREKATIIVDPEADRRVVIRRDRRGWGRVNE
jgi:hypothetical protein